MTPGGFKAFEHRWAMAEAFELHDRIGKSNVAQRTHELASLLKEGLSNISSVVVRTPRSADLSAGIVSLSVEGADPALFVASLRKRNIIASVAPYAEPYIRLTPSIRNNEAEIQTVLNTLSRSA
jgi:selenocysteine lyase/cysteine desulfurase